MNERATEYQGLALAQGPKRRMELSVARCACLLLLLFLLPRLLTLPLILLLATQSHAQPFIYHDGRLTPTAQEQALVTELNSAYYAAFTRPREENWVLQKIAEGSMRSGCWLDQETFYSLESREIFSGTEMQCVQIGKSTRIFWPSRWVRFCEQIHFDYGRCVIERFNPT